MNRAMLAVLAVGFVAAVGFAQTEADFTVTLTKDGQGVVITKYKGKATEVVIPAQIQGMPVREIAYNAFTRFNNSDMPRITSVVIPDGITEIGNGAFGYQDLTSVTIPPSVTLIGYDAFSSCRNLTTVTMTSPNVSFRTVGGFSSIFESCTKLTTVNLPDGMANIPPRMFARCTSLTTIRLPEGLKKIYPEAFYLSGLTTVTFPASLEEIDAGAFQECELATISLPAGIKRLGNRAFRGQGNALTEVIIPDSVTAISFDGYPFAYCPNINLASQAALRKVGYTGF